MQPPNTRHEIMITESQLRLPPQAAPIDRTMTRSVIAGGSGVEPSLIWHVPWHFPWPFPGGGIPPYL